MPNIDEFKHKNRLRACNKDILEQLKFEKPFKKEEEKPDTNLTQTSHKPTTNLLQTDYKVGTNLEQSGNKLGTNLLQEPTSNHIQTPSKPTSNPHQEPVPNPIQTYSKLTSNLIQENETPFKPTPQPTPQLTPNLLQTPSKPNPKISFSSLVGLQRNILLTIFSSSKTSRTKTTEPLTLEFISNEAKTTNKSTKTAIQRLIKKGFMKTEEYKNGRGGWCKFSIPDFLYQELLNLESYSKLTSNPIQTPFKVPSQPHPQPTPTALNNNNNYINNITTTTERDVVKETGEEYKKIDFSFLSEIGFGITQISQLAELKILPDLIQESINHFAFGLKHNEKTKEIPNPLYRLMGVLRKGNVWTEDNYESAQDIAMREYIERLEREKEQRRARYERIFELKYDEWFEELSDEELKKILTADEFKFGKYANESKLKIYFRRTKCETIKTHFPSPLNQPNNER